MIKYYKQINESGDVVMLLTYDFDPIITNPLIIEITKEEYEALLAEIVEKNEEIISDEATEEDL